jgi:threonine aldolase
MRQAGVIAAAGLYALDHNVARLAEDHANARVIAQAVEACPTVRLMRPAVPTNIVTFDTHEAAAAVAARIRDENVLIGTMGPNTLRCVTHLGVNAAEAGHAAAVIAQVLSA